MSRTGIIIFLIRWVILLRHPWLSLWYRRKDRCHRIPNPALPRTMNEKFFWRKVFDHNPNFTTVSDKIAVREWLKKQGVDVQAPSILWVGVDASQIPDDLLGQGVVVKANHGCGTNIMLPSAPKSRMAFNTDANHFLKQDHGRRRTEWGYFGIDRKLLLDELVPGILAEFKIYTFGARIERLVVIYNRFQNMTADIWLPGPKNEWVRYEGDAAVSSSRANKPLPATIGAALAVAEQIGLHFDHMRVDILTDGQQIWFGELTVYNMAGHLPLAGDDPMQTVNTAWDLRSSWFLRQPQTGWRGIYAAALLQHLPPHHVN